MQALPLFDELVRPDAVHRAVYVDRDVFEAEQERIFKRAWLYVGHESEVPNPGDYVLTRLGPEEVLLVRQPGGSLALLHNRCAHRGARVAVAPRGNVRSFNCAYHAWSYALDGALLGVPQEETYPPEFAARRRALGLGRVPRVESYRGFVFGSHADTGPDLEGFLGPLASAIDNLVDRAPAGTVSAAGGRLRMAYRGNWKMFLENAVDLVHPGHVHVSSVAAARQERAVAAGSGQAAQTAQMMLSNGLTAEQWDQVPVHAFPGGHVYMGGFYRDGVIAPERADPVFERYRALLAARHGETRTAEILAVDRFNNIIWPGMTLNSRFQVIRVVQPLGPDHTVVTSQVFRLDGAPDEMFALSLRFLNTASSPASLVASDDLEIFERCQQGLADSANDWIDVSRGVLRDVRKDDGSESSPGITELAMRAQLQAWKACMADQVE
jgi:phenylpropionate dioxygenase-like ring-hydroxylating dioxygenase large terminal subunit